MLDTRIVCPHCGKRLKTAQPVSAGDRLRCPGCHLAFQASGSSGPPASVPARPVAPIPVAAAYAPPPTQPQLALPTAPAIDLSPQPSNPTRGMGLIVGGALCILMLTVGLVIGLAGRKKEKEIPQEDSRAQADPRKELSPTPRQSEEKPTPRKTEQPIKEVRNDPDPDPDKKQEPDRDPVRIRLPLREEDRRVERDPPPPPTRFTLSAEKQEQVNKAIDRGVAYLRKTQLPDGSWPGNAGHALGLASFPGLTLLECGVPVTDSAVQKALTYVRAHAPGSMQTYDISLAILFLDRVGDPKDRRLIQRLGLRLMAGQQPSGGWTYLCRDIFTNEEELALFEVLQKTRPRDPLELFEVDRKDDKMAFFVDALPRLEGTTARLKVPEASTVVGPFFGGPLKTFGTINSTARDSASLPLEELRPLNIDPEKLPEKLKNLPMFQPVPRAQDLPHDRSDNSNTQFGILGVWAAVKYGVPMERTLAMLVKRFRKSQNNDGSWGYHFGTNGATPGSAAMTGVGLLGLAVGHGLVSGSDPEKARPVLKDPAIVRGFTALAQHLDSTAPPPARGGGLGNPRKIRVFPRAAQANCYFLWTTERVGILYNLDEIGDCNWYEWCVDVLLPRQLPEGSWTPSWGYIVADTCQALLVLRRANLTRDLTARLNFRMKVKEEK